MRATIGIYEREDISIRSLNAAIARRAGSGPRFMQQARAAMAGDDACGRRNRAIVNNNNFKQRSVQALTIKTAKAVPVG